MNDLVLYYGPNEENGIVKYRPQILKRLVDILKHLDFNISIERIKPRDRLVISLSSFNIFQCRLSFLKETSTNENYHLESDDETTLEKAIFAVIEAQARFSLSPFIE